MRFVANDFANAVLLKPLRLESGNCRTSMSFPSLFALRTRSSSWMLRFW
jgi:hypothetical protein